MLRSLFRLSPKLGRGALFGVLLVASAASAEPARVGQRPAPDASSTNARVRLSCDKQRCLRLHVSRRWLTAARASTVVPATVASFAPAGPRSSNAAPAAPALRALSVGAHIALRSGRELDLQLTPTPTRCAPLLSLRY
jgi:hypothetical protein